MTTKTMNTCFMIADILRVLLVGVEPHDRVRLTISSPHFEHESWRPFRTSEQMTADRVMIEVDRVLQSNQEWMFEGDFYLNFIHAPLPVGAGFARNIGTLENLLKKKRCLLQIPHRNDMMCCARAIVTAKARLDEHPRWNSIRQGADIQTILAENLHEQAQVQMGVPCGKPEWVKFQQAIGADYQLIVLSREFFNSIVYTGPHYSEKQVVIYHAENHFSVITSMKAFFNKTYYCTKCHVGYQNDGTHKCKHGCKYCHAKTLCTFVAWHSCTTCHRSFASQACYDKHLANATCRLIQCCAQCGQTFHTYRKHYCGYLHCRQCKKSQPKDHKCHIQPLPHNKETSRQVYLFYDFECMLDDAKKHVPNLCVVNKVCSKCIENDIKEFCCDCQRQQLIFKGSTTLQDFGTWLFSGKNKGAIAIAHNAQSYDLYLIMDFVHANGIKPELIQNGKKILCLHANGLKFIDSLNYFSTSLAKLPDIFGLTEMHKGFFPHLFSTAEHQRYQGPIPPAEYYDPDGMKADKRDAFYTWYRQQKHFDFQLDLEKYCISDVDILQRCCGKFRSLFIQHADGIDPFAQAVTIASACNEVYRKLFLEPEQIAIIPTQGYQPDRQSVIAMCWLDWVAAHNHTTIQHARNGGEMKVEGYKVDGVDLQNGTVLEFQGCFFHGCSSCYENRSTVNPICGISMEELRQRTRLKTDYLRRKGHTVVEKWECDFRTEIKQNQELQDFYQQYQPHEPIQPRQAFTGGRVNAITLFYEPKEGEQIRYVDFTSLYPYVCKYARFPIGHPEIYKGGDIPNHIEGLLKCKVLPPPLLFHPVLPFKANSKLLFPLCRSCAITNNQSRCPHDNIEDRALTGTWVSAEIDKAVELGYVILEKYEAWHFPNTTQYDHVTKKGGLWAAYIDLWLQQKQQADGFPSWCQNDEDKTQYIKDYLEHEGISLDPAKIERNEGLRSVAKVMLNSHWGKFGQNPSKTKLTYISDPHEYINMMTDDSIEVTDLLYVNEEHVALRWIHKDQFVESLPNTNVVLAAYTTAHARLKLYSLLENLQDRILYMDTDSAVYIHREDSWNPPLGDYLGELKDETKGVPITTFVSGGAKNYAYQLANGTTVCKIRGFTLNCRNSLTLNFESMKKLVTTPGEFHKSKNEKTSCTIQEPHKILRKDGHLYSEAQDKQYRLVYDKRIIGKDLKTFPFGWTQDM
jgi:hypothetical protein